MLSLILIIAKKINKIKTHNLKFQKKKKIKMPAPQQRMKVAAEKYSKNVEKRGNVPKSSVIIIH